MKNPILSMTGNMWAALRMARKLKGTGRYLPAEVTRGTTEALVRRGLLEWVNHTTVHVTISGVMVCDAFTEGQESVK